MVVTTENDLTTVEIRNKLSVGDKLEIVKEVNRLVENSWKCVRSALAHKAAKRTLGVTACSVYQNA